MNAEHATSSLWKEAFTRLWRSHLNRACLAVIAVFTLTALWGEIDYRRHQWADKTPAYQVGNLAERYQPPSWPEHPLGTDNLGRDVLARLIQGTRIAFHVGVLTSLIAIPIGLLLGCLAGYYGGRVDRFVVWLYSSVASMPGLLFILAIAVVVGKGLPGIYLGIGLTTWVGLCRLVRAEVMKHRELPYVQAARTLGFSNTRILLRHILPNILHLALVVFSIRFPAAVSTEVFMSFLGIGVQNEPSWGIMISNARLRLWQGVWWELTAVTVAILLIVLAFNMLGDALRDAFDPRLRTSDR
jgi:peptide/nickel transport system permease protein